MLELPSGNKFLPCEISQEQNVKQILKPLCLNLLEYILLSSFLGSKKVFKKTKEKNDQ